LKALKVAFCKAILIAGGFDGSGVIADSEMFDVTTNSWSQAPPMNVKRSALSLATVSGLPNRKQYLPYWKAH